MTERPSDDIYREAAKRMYGQPVVATVSPWAPVMRASGGAFIEIQVWVPEAEATAILEERAFNAPRLKA